MDSRRKGTISLAICFGGRQFSVKTERIRQMMKKLVILLAIMLLAGAIWLVFRARIRVDVAAMRYDPTAMVLHVTDPPLIRSTPQSYPVQTGLVDLPDGELVKFWFISHHVAGPGCARFDFSDGTTRYMWGSSFCCEVQISGEKIKSRKDLIEFIETDSEF